LIQAIYVNNLPKKKITEKEVGKIIIQKTPFYAESGGQVGDTGKIYSENGIFKVFNTKKYGNFFVHKGKMKFGKIKKNDQIQTKINLKRRKLIERNHTSVHILSSGLKKILGEHVSQKGSLINEKKIRFDFSHFKRLTSNQIYKIEKFVNKIIQKNIKVNSFLTDFNKINKKKISFLPNKIYKKKVRVISIEKTSNELCSGTHVKKTGNIIIFKIINERGISFGTRRIKAITYKKAFKKILKQEKNIQKIKKIIKSKNSNLINPIKKIIQEKNELLQEKNEITKKIHFINFKKNI